MKLIMAIVNNDDSSVVSNHLTEKGFFATKLATTGGFLKAGNTTFLIGTEEEKVDDALSIIREYSKKRTQILPAMSSLTPGYYDSIPIEVQVGGATIFVMDVENFEKC